MPLPNRAALILAALCLPGATAHAFDIDGYRDGMTLVEVVALAGPLLPAGSRPGEREVHFMARRPDGSPDAGFLFVFCEDRLSAYQRALRGPPAFAEALAAETGRRGPGAYRAEHVVMAGGAIGSLRFEWPEGEGRFVMTMIGSERQFTAVRRWEARTTPCR